MASGGSSGGKSVVNVIGGGWGAARVVGCRGRVRYVGALDTVEVPVGLRVSEGWEKGKVV
jgi:hypothetical protein